MNTVIKQIEHIASKIGRTIHIMEVCGTHTVAIFRHGIRSVLPENIRLLSGPGCPVCVTSIDDVDTAIALTEQSNVILATFGDMMRVPGSKKTLYDAKAAGGDVRIVYSPMDALSYARDHVNKKVVFFATGFETTSPSVAGTLFIAEQEGIENFFIYSVHKLVPPALHVLVGLDDVQVDGFILPGHVSTMIGISPYRFLSEQHKIASVIAGFGSEDILHGILMLLSQISSGNVDVEVQYKSVVREDGNPKAMEILWKFFTPADSYWRGIGSIKRSGLALKDGFSHRDILKHVPVKVQSDREPVACRCGDVLIGKIIPTDCSLFGKTCLPEKPVGACMVSTEGSCAAYYKYGRGSWNA